MVCKYVQNEISELKCEQKTETLSDCVFNQLWSVAIVAPH